MSSDRFARVKSVLFAVSELKGEARAAYLAKVYEEDPSIRNEVESLLRHDEHSAGFGTRRLPHLAPTAPGSGRPTAASTPSLVGGRIGDYEILEELGRGGMGVVYRARSPRREDDIALKVLPEDARHPDRLERFAAEARLLASLNHPNVARIHTVEQDGDLHFLTMERIEGASLAEHLANGPLPLGEVLPIARQVASALEAAHARGIIHRDIKPLNVMIRPDRQVRVLDFGIAKALRGEESLAAPGAPEARAPGRPAPGPGVADPGKTVTRVIEPERCTPRESPGASPGGGTSDANRSFIMGTPGYMSPERLTGSPASERADIWSFGCLLYECLVGKLPFRGDTLEETLRATLEAEPRMEELPDSVPPRLREFLGRCLAKDPATRFPSMGSVRREIDEMLGEAETDGLVSVRRPASDSVSKSNLPRRLTSFIGREREIGEITELLRERRLVTLTGFGGCGKTRLSIEVAEAQLGRFPDGVWQVELASVAQGSLVPDAIQTALGIEPGRTASVTETVIRYLRHRTVLIVLDNCEHVREGCAGFLSVALAELPALCVLTTSREPIELPGEKIYEVRTLSIPTEEADTDVGSSEAFRLFLDRSRSVRPELELSAAERAVVAGICRRLDGIPLAIELAAARLRQESLAELAAGLDQALGVLAGGTHSTLPRHQTLRGVIDWSYERLDSREKVVLRRLAVFAGDGWTRSAAEEVSVGEQVAAWEVSLTVDRLIEKSLIQREVVEAVRGRASRSRLLETVRAYARERLDASGEAAEALGRHRDYYLDLVERGERELASAAQKEWADRLEAENANVIQAIEFSCGLADGVPHAQRLATAMRGVWGLRGHFALGRAVLGRVLSVDSPARPTRERARAAYSAGILAFYQGDLSEAHVWYEEAIRIHRHHGDRREEANSLARLAEVLKERGDLDDALVSLEESLRILTELDDRSGVASAHTGLGNVYDDRNDRERALAHYQESLRIRREIGPPSAIGDALHNVASSLSSVGDATGAQEAFEESLTIRRELGNRRGVAGSLNNLGVLAENAGRYEEAEKLYEESLAIKRELGHPRGTVSSLANLGHVLRRLGELDRAREHLDEAVLISRTLGRGRALATCLAILGSIENAAGNFPRGCRLYEEALEIQRSLGDRRSECNALLGLGESAQGLRDREAARRLFAESMERRCELGSLGRIAEQLESYAWFEAELGDGAEAARLFGVAGRMREVYGLTLLEEEQARENTRRERVRDQLGAVRFEEEFGRGRRMSVDEAIRRVTSKRA